MAEPVIQILILVLGLALVVCGASILVDGASSLARRFGVSEFVIGLTIVGFGTSLPELVVSVTGALEGNSAIAIGNVIGSNIFNTVFILALSVLFVPVAISPKNRKRDIPVTLLVTLLVAVLGMAGCCSGGWHGLSRIEGLLLVLLFAGYIFWCFRTDEPEENASEGGKIHSPAFAALMVVVGLSALIAGGRFFVNSSVRLAQIIGVSDKYIAVTVLAMGTSLPELVTSIVAIAKNRNQMALGNILGSNVFNLLLILGLSAALSPMSFASVNLTDVAALVLSIILVWTAVYTGRRNVLDRFDAVLMLILFAAYMTLLTIKL